MNNKDEINSFKKVIYHELGHVLGYILSNKSNITKLGPIKSIEIGAERNCVTPLYLIYHSDDKETIKTNTRNIDRTIAWFIEVILGCTLECCFSSYDFKDCYNEKNNGRFDFTNMASIRTSSSFIWQFEDVYKMQILLQAKIKEYNILSEISPIVDTLLNEICLNETNQLQILGDELEKIYINIEEKISKDFYSDYLNLISNFKLLTFSSVII